MTTYTTDQLRERLMTNLTLRDSFTESATNYGVLEEIAAQNIDGKRISVDYAENKVDYIVPRNGAWTAGIGAIRIDRAMRIFDENEEQIKIREIRHPVELESVAAGLYLEILKLLEGRK